MKKKNEKNVNKDDSFFTFEKRVYNLSAKQRAYILFKRILDIVISFFMLLLLSPILLILAIMVKMTSKGNVIFSQDRIGQYGKVIKVYKFRTMMMQAPQSKSTLELSNSGEYVTKVGKFLRATSLDEILQLFNVIKGDMSIIGPRPLIPEEYEVHKLRKENDVYLIRPGITGLAQVNGRDYLDAESKVRFDTQYLHSLSLSMDVKIIFKSLAVVFKQKDSFDKSI